MLSILVASFVAATTGVGAAVADAGNGDGHSAPNAVTYPATDVGPRSAVLHGTVDPNGGSTGYAFAYGTTTAYGMWTPPGNAGSGNNPVAVSYTLAGLVPNTTYHVRLWASNHDGYDSGADVTFTTPSESTGGGTPPPGSPGSPATPATPGSAPPLAPADAPELGHSVNVTETAGTVLVRVPGTTSSVPLSGVASIPVGAIVDTRMGTIELETALPGAGTQSATFHGGLFAIRQSAAGGGMTELVLRGPKPTCAAGGARAAATSKKSPPRSLWGSDHGGRFRTRGSNAVATVRGTSWFMTDRCDGTYTRVKNGSVSVRELRSGRTVVLRAGQSHLARATR